MRKQQGFIGLILLIILALILLKFFLNLDVFQAADSQQGQETIGYTHQLLSTAWNYIGPPIKFAWQNVLWPIIGLVWESFQSFLAWGHQTASTMPH